MGRGGGICEGVFSRSSCEFERVFACFLIWIAAPRGGSPGVFSRGSSRRRSTREIEGRLCDWGLFCGVRGRFCLSAAVPHERAGLCGPLTFR